MTRCIGFNNDGSKCGCNQWPDGRGYCYLHGYHDRVRDDEIDSREENEEYERDGFVIDDDNVFAQDNISTDDYPARNRIVIELLSSSSDNLSLSSESSNDDLSFSSESSSESIEILQPTRGSPRLAVKKRQRDEVQAVSNNKRPKLARGIANVGPEEDSIACRLSLLESGMLKLDKKLDLIIKLLGGN